MNFKEIYNPQYVYEGFFETYFIRPFFHHYADFRTPESGGSCLRSLLAWFVVTLGIAGIMMGQVGLLGPEVGFTALIVVAVIWGIFSLTPLVALVARTANGAPEKPFRPKMLGVDTLLAACCLLFFLLGLPMMITTLNSGSLNPDAGMTDETDTALFEEEYVKEEPIFTYQDEAAAQPEEISDSLNDMNEPDLVTQEESFDPTLTSSDEIIEEPASDSIF